MRVFFVSSAIVALAFAATSRNNNNGDVRKKGNNEESKRDVSKGVQAGRPKKETSGMMTKATGAKSDMKRKEAELKEMEKKIASEKEKKAEEPKSLTAEDVSSIVSKHLEAFFEKIKEKDPKVEKHEPQTEAKEEKPKVDSDKKIGAGTEDKMNVEEEVENRRPKSRRNRKAAKKDEKKATTDPDQVLAPIAEEKKEKKDEEPKADSLQASVVNVPEKDTITACPTNDSAKKASNEPVVPAVNAAVNNDDSAKNAVVLLDINMTAAAVLSPFEVQRRNLMDRIYQFICRESDHPLNTLLSKVAALLGQLDEKKIDMIWSELGPHRQQAIIEDFLKFTEAMVALNRNILTKCDGKIPTLHYAPGSLEALEIKEDSRFVRISEAFRKISKHYNPKKTDFLAFIEALMELIERDALFDAVEVDIFNPLYLLIQSWEETYCGYPAGAKRGKPLQEIYQIFVDDVKVALGNVLGRITDDNCNKDGYLQINRHPGEGRLWSKPSTVAKTSNSNALAAQKSTRLAKIILATSAGLYLLLVLMVFVQNSCKQFNFGC